MEILKLKQTTLLFAVFTALLLTGCGKIRDIRVERYHVESVELRGKGLDAVLDLQVNNPAKTLELTRIQGRIHLKEETVARYEADPVTIEGRTTGNYPVTCHLELAEDVSVFKFLSKASSSNLEDVTVDFSAKVRMKGGLGKKIRLENIPALSLQPTYDN